MRTIQLHPKMLLEVHLDQDHLDNVRLRIRKNFPEAENSPFEVFLTEDTLDQLIETLKEEKKRLGLK